MSQDLSHCVSILLSATSAHLTSPAVISAPLGVALDVIDAAKIMVYYAPTLGTCQSDKRCPIRDICLRDPVAQIWRSMVYSTQWLIVQIPCFP